MSFIDLPKWVDNKKACINMLNNSAKMRFKYAVRRSSWKVYEKDHPCRLYQYKTLDHLNWENLNCLGPRVRDYCFSNNHGSGKWLRTWTNQVLFFHDKSPLNHDLGNIFGLSSTFRKSKEFKFTAWLLGGWAIQVVGSVASSTSTEKS